MKCQEHVKLAEPLVFEGVTFHLTNCDKPVPAWRMCGLGCKVEIAYCKDHGGDERAAREMEAHHVNAHGMVIAKLPIAQPL